METNALIATQPVVNETPGNGGAVPRRVPVVKYLVLGEPPFLQAHGCDSCSAVYFDRRNACARCSASAFSPVALASTGQVLAYTVVHRAAPNVPVPYMSVVVDLDGGGVVKSTLIGVTDPGKITPGLRVTLTTFTAGIDDDGTEAVAFGYEIDGEKS